MSFFRNLSIKNKLIALILMINVFLIGIGFAVVILNDIKSFKMEMIENTTAIARVIGDYSVVDLAFYDKEASQKTLAKLNTISNIETAYLYDAKGKLFSSYSKTSTITTAPAVRTRSSIFEGGYLHTYEPILEDGQNYGTIYLRANTAELTGKIRNYLLTMLLLMVGLIALSLILAFKLQRFISEPILNLANAAGKISEQGDYSIRVRKGGEDEIGMLCDSFNNMVEQIQARQAERDKAEEALRLSERRFRHIVEQSNDAFYVLVGRKLVFINPKFEQYLGYTLQETMSPEFDVMNLAAAESKELLETREEKRIRGEELPNQYIFRAISKSGTTYDFEANVSAIEWDGTPAILGTLRDVTERLKSEKRLRAQQEQLRLYAEELERSNRELDQFAYVTSHDLKAPLQAISNLSEWIEEDIGDRLSGESLRHMDLLRKRVQRMVALIEGILEYSRVRRMRQKPEKVDVGKLLIEVIDMLHPPSGFVVEVQEGMPTVETEKTRLHQVFANMIGNAIKHHHQQEGVIRIGFRDAGALYDFSVSDDGPGIAPEFHEKVFVIFQTLKARDKFESTGVGLALAKKIVEDKGGVITLDSQEGKGATFHFTWPKKEGNHE